jgi:hypothetical protein
LHQCFSLDHSGGTEFALAIENEPRD